MSTLVSSPRLTSTKPRAPEPSAALLALQQKGLELPGPSVRTGSISPQSNIVAPVESLRVSPLSFLSTPSRLDKPLSLREWDRRPSSARSRHSARSAHSGRSADKELENILSYYMNSSEHSLSRSLKSEYEELTPYPDDSDAERSEPDFDSPPVTAVWAPKAYLDTIAPLLKYQISNFNLAAPAQSPQSIASSAPKIMHPNAARNESTALLQLIPEPSPNLPPTALSDVAGLSSTSIQIPPGMSPLPHLPDPDPFAAPTLQQYSQNLRERKIVLEDPDVRDAESWYDQPLSPISPEDIEYRNQIRESQQSAVSPDEVGYNRALTFDRLSMSTTRAPTYTRPISFVQNEILPGPMTTALNQFAYNSILLAPIDPTTGKLSRQASARMSEGATPARTPEIRNEYPGQERHSQQSSLDTATPLARMLDPLSKIEPAKSQDLNLPSSQRLSVSHDPIEAPMRGYLKTPPPPPDRLPSSNSDRSNTNLGAAGIEEVCRPGSAFSDFSGDAHAHEIISSQLKSVLKLRKKNKNKNKSKDKDKDKERERKGCGDTKKWKEKPESEATRSAITRAQTDTADGRALDYQDDLDSYKFPYKLAHISPPNGMLQSPHRLHSPPVASAASQARNDMIDGCLASGSGPGPTVSRSPSPSPPIPMRKPLPPPPPPATVAVVQSQPLSRPQICINNTSPVVPSPNSDPPRKSGPTTDQFAFNAFHSRPTSSRTSKPRFSHSHDHKTSTSTAVTIPSAESGLSHPSTDTTSTTTKTRPITASSSHIYVQAQTAPIKLSSPSSDQTRRSGGVPPSGSATYNNALFEASGGQKKKGGGAAKFASRLMMSAEEKRRLKVKESITIVPRGLGGK